MKTLPCRNYVADGNNGYFCRFRDDDVDIDHDSRRVTFKETFMFVTYMKKFETVHGVRYTCKQDKGANKYWALKRLTHGGDSGQYTCIQVIPVLLVSPYLTCVKIGDTGRATAHRQ